jgi:hypothetical protein
MEFTARIRRTVEEVRDIQISVHADDLIGSTLAEAIEYTVSLGAARVLDEDTNVFSDWELDTDTIEEA